MCEEARRIGSRIKAAREALGVTQEELAFAVGFASRQILSDLERGVRDIRASEAVRIARLLHVDLSALLSEPSPQSLVLCLSEPSEGVEAIEAEFLQWCDRQHRVLRLLGQRPVDGLPTYGCDLSTMTYEDADRLSREVGRTLDLGVRPARTLGAALGSHFDVTVWYLDTPSGCAACTRGPHGVSILVSRSRAPWRRQFDIVHELFHLLTWTGGRGSHPPDESHAPGDRVEKLGDVFASSLLLPADLVIGELEERSVGRRVKLAGLVAMSREFGVSPETLVRRLHDLGCLPDAAAVIELLDDPRFRDCGHESLADDWPEPPSLPERFVQAAYTATLAGRLSRSQLATYLDCGLAELPGSLVRYGIDDDLAEVTSRDVPLTFRTGNLETRPMPRGQAEA